MPYIAQMVHYEYGGLCNAAVISAFWEDQDLAQLTVMRQAGGQPWTVSRATKGNYGDDQHWHTLGECPNVGLATEAAVAPADVDGGDTTGEVAAKPAKRGRKPKSA